MTVVSDASPVCYLVLIGEIELLAKLFTGVLLPRAVLGELLAQGAPPAVRAWASALPAWISIRDDPPGTPVGLERLQPGECAAILLTESIRADLVLLDEKSPRRIAAERGLRVTGVLGVLAEAASLGLVDLPKAIDRLTKTNFRYSPALLKSVVERISKR